MAGLRLAVPFMCLGLLMLLIAAIVPIIEFILSSKWAMVALAGATLTLAGAGLWIFENGLLGWIGEGFVRETLFNRSVFATALEIRSAIRHLSEPKQGDPLSVTEVPREEKTLLASAVRLGALTMMSLDDDLVQDFIGGMDENAKRVFFAPSPLALLPPALQQLVGGRDVSSAARPSLEKQDTASIATMVQELHQAAAEAEKQRAAAREAARLKQRAHRRIAARIVGGLTRESRPPRERRMASAPVASAMSETDRALRSIGVRILYREVVSYYERFAPHWLHAIVAWLTPYVEHVVELSAAPATRAWRYLNPPAEPPLAPPLMAARWTALASTTASAKEE